MCLPSTTVLRGVVTEKLRFVSSGIRPINAAMQPIRRNGRRYSRSGAIGPVRPSVRLEGNRRSERNERNGMTLGVSPSRYPWTQDHVNG